jgi:hypothetical protein
MRFADYTKVVDILCAERRGELSQAHRGLFRTPFYWQAFRMVPRRERIDDFDHEGTLPADLPLQILCENHAGTYVVPFLCRWHDGAWLGRELIKLAATVLLTRAG